MPMLLRESHTAIESWITKTVRPGIAVNTGIPRGYIHHNRAECDSEPNGKIVGEVLGLPVYKQALGLGVVQLYDSSGMIATASI